MSVNIAGYRSYSEAVDRMKPDDQRGQGDFELEGSAGWWRMWVGVHLG